MANILLYNSIIEEADRYRASIQEYQQAEADRKFSEESYDPQYWTALPYDATNYDPSRELYVCEDAAVTNCWNCGASCTWTVPAGTTTAQFQIWGAGAQVGTGCCCGGSGYGATGAYASAIVPVTPGDTYTLCAGCAHCCQITRTSWVCQGSSSTVSGPDATMEAKGGCSGVFRHMELRGATCCRYQFDVTGQGGACICNGGADYCFNSSCESCGEIPYTVDTDATWSGTVTGDCICGLGSMFGIACFDTNHYGYKIHAPVISPTHTVTPGTCDCCSTFTSGTCCGGCQCNAVNNIRQVFGAGATYNHVMGGGNSNSADKGRAGLVRVTWW
jgi:hypothetical protein